MKLRASRPFGFPHLILCIPLISISISTLVLLSLAIYFPPLLLASSMSIVAKFATKPQVASF
jgi:hypothetical protein